MSRSPASSSALKTVRRIIRRFVPLSVVLAFAGCGDPLVVLGDLPGFMRLVAGVPEVPGTVTDSLATATRLISPVGVTVLPNGDLLVLDDARRILSVTTNGRLHVLYTGPQCFDQTCLTKPQGTVLLDPNTALIADNGADHIWRFDLPTRALASFAGTGVHGSAPDGTPAQQATLASPSDLMVLPDGRVLFTERAGHRIRIIGTDGRLQTLAGTGVAGRSGDGGPAASAQLNAPTGLAINGNDLYVTEYGSHIVRHIDLGSGTIRTIAGTGVRGFSGDGGPALMAKLDQPWAAELSPDGATLYFTDVGNHRVRSVNLSTGVIDTFAGTGATEYNGNGRAAGQTALHNPFGLAVAPQGFLYIADTSHHVVWRVPIRF